MSLNQIILQGRACSNPDLRYTQNQKPVATFTIAVDRDFAQAGEKREADFVPVVAWSKTAEFCDQYIIKGTAVIVTGRLQSREWTDRDNNKRRAWEVIADRVYFGESKRKEEAPAARTEAPRAGFREMDDTDGDLPF